MFRQNLEKSSVVQYLALTLFFIFTNVQIALADSMSDTNGVDSLHKLKFNYSDLNRNSSNPFESTTEKSGMIDCMVEPNKVVEVASSVSGVIKEVFVERGSIIKKGEILAVLESGVEESNAKHAKVKLNFHKKKFKRIKSLFEKKVISHYELEEAKTEMELAEHENNRAQELLRLRSIRSPFSGIVVDRYISPGELTEQQKVLKIAQIDPLKVEIVAPISLYGSVNNGMYAKIWPEGPEKGPFDADIDVIDKVIDAASGTFGIRLTMPNSKYSIPAGVKCSAKFHPQSKAQKLAKKKAKRTKKRKKSTKSASKSATGVIKAQAKVMISSSSISSIVKKKSSPSVRPTFSELEEMVFRFVTAYEDGDIVEFEKLFSDDARTNDEINILGIKQEYGTFFSKTIDRQIFINDMDWSFHGSQANGYGYLQGLVLYEDDSDVQVIKKKIRFAAKKVNGKILITHLFHYEM